jgi:hypothetical protein
VWRAGLVVAAVLVPSIASAIVLQPRSHYLALQAVLVPLFALTWASQQRTLEFEQRAVEVIRASAVLRSPQLVSAFPPDLRAVALATFVAVSAPQVFQHSPAEAPLPNLAVVRYLEAEAANLPPAPSFADVGILEADGGYDAYAGLRFRRISPAERRPIESFQEFLERRGVRVVVVSPRLSAHHRMANDQEFGAFAAAPEAFGFSPRVIERSDRMVAIAHDSRAPSAGRASVQVPGESQMPIRLR